MKGAVERLRPHNSSLFRLGCLPQSTIYTTTHCVFLIESLAVKHWEVYLHSVPPTFGPLLLGGSRQWNQEVLCLSPPSSAPLPPPQWTGGMQCCFRGGWSAEKMAPPTQSVDPPWSSYYSSSSSRPILPVTDLNHQILGPSFLFSTDDLYTGLDLSTTLSLISKRPIHIGFSAICL